jgi:hypothetical protein
MILPNEAIIKKIIARPGSLKRVDEDGTLISIAAPRFRAAIISYKVILFASSEIQR